MYIYCRHGSTPPRGVYQTLCASTRLNRPRGYIYPHTAASQHTRTRTQTSGRLFFALCPSVLEHRPSPRSCLKHFHFDKTRGCTAAAPRENRYRSTSRAWRSPLHATHRDERFASSLACPVYCYRARVCGCSAAPASSAFFLFDTGSISRARFKLEIQRWFMLNWCYGRSTRDNGE